MTKKINGKKKPAAGRKAAPAVPAAQAPPATPVVGTIDAALAVIRSADTNSVVNLTDLNGRSIALVRSARGLDIQSDMDEGVAADILTDIRKLKADAEAMRKSIVTPFNELVDRINAPFKPIAADLKDATDALDVKVREYRKYKEELRLAEQKKRDEEYQRRVDAERAEHERQAAQAREAGSDLEEPPPMVGAYIPPPPPPAVLPNDNMARGSQGSIGTRKTWTFEIVDMRQVPVEYLRVDDVSIRGRIRVLASNRQDPTNAIPGIRAYQTERITGRG